MFLELSSWRINNLIGRRINFSLVNFVAAVPDTEQHLSRLVREFNRVSYFNFESLISTSPFRPSSLLIFTLPTTAAVSSQDAEARAQGCTGEFHSPPVPVVQGEVTGVKPELFEVSDLDVRATDPLLDTCLALEVFLSRLVVTCYHTSCRATTAPDRLSEDFSYWLSVSEVFT
ncbi:hypothetical protein J6590_062686 [Homalodisca vitripennis]|nr:hypothetical protein J6590_062686 [Homalodisca vitripennis]